MRLCLAPFVLAFTACSPPCDPLGHSRPEEICQPADAGTVTPGAPFVLTASTYASAASCQVVVDGGQLDLQISGATNCGGAAGFGKPPIAGPVRCEVPALAPGRYAVNTVAPSSFTLSDAGVSGISPCL